MENAGHELEMLQLQPCSIQKLEEVRVNLGVRPEPEMNREPGSQTFLTPLLPLSLPPSLSGCQSSDCKQGSSLRWLLREFSICISICSRFSWPRTSSHFLC
ncbi:hypothetical protein SAY87_015464 [Trapa incisa]|uniref:Uncharacterized protein n=1 Tax=Trapa incisa TaxID=236973 RepID=A0AAN7GXC2_9MYRT|nr:hypothetical protein SAY87_015464 [Trapa incisa]